jgi:hypothetical protein
MNRPPSFGRSEISAPCSHQTTGCFNFPDSSHFSSSLQAIPFSRQYASASVEKKKVWGQVIYLHNRAERKNGDGEINDSHFPFFIGTFKKIGGMW